MTGLPAKIPHQVCQPTDITPPPRRVVRLDQMVAAFRLIAESDMYPEGGLPVAHALAHPSLSSERVQACWERLQDLRQLASDLLGTTPQARWDSAGIVLHSKGVDTSDHDDLDALTSLSLEYVDGDMDAEVYELATGHPIGYALAQDRVERIGFDNA
jgi:hypothetical protein